MPVMIETTQEVREVVNVDKHTLTIVASLMDTDEWAVRIENEQGVRSCWHEWFATADIAVRIARRAIAEEGANTFINVKGFEYLN